MYGGGVPKKLTKPTLCKVFPLLHPFPRVPPRRARSAPPCRFGGGTRAAYPEGGGLPGRPSERRSVASRAGVGAIKLRSRGAGAGDARTTSPLRGPFCLPPGRRHLRVAPRAEPLCPGAQAALPLLDHVALLLCGLAHHQGLFEASARAVRAAPGPGFLHPFGRAVPFADVRVRGSRLPVPQERRLLRVPSVRHLAPARRAGSHGRWRFWGRRPWKRGTGGRRRARGRGDPAPAQGSVPFGSRGPSSLREGEPRAPSPSPAAAPPPSPSPPRTPAARLGGGGGSVPGSPPASRTCLRRHRLQRGRSTEIPLPLHG